MPESLFEDVSGVEVDGMHGGFWAFGAERRSFGVFVGIGDTRNTRNIYIKCIGNVGMVLKRHIKLLFYRNVRYGDANPRLHRYVPLNTQEHRVEKVLRVCTNKTTVSSGKTLLPLQGHFQHSTGTAVTPCSPPPSSPFFTTTTTSSSAASSLQTIVSPCPCPRGQVKNSQI